jgi:SOS response regulatory protein OraA/RecX
MENLPLRSARMKSAPPPAESDEKDIARASARAKGSAGAGRVYGDYQGRNRSRQPPDALTAALRFLARGDRSTNQVTAFLSDRGYARPVIRAARQSLERLGYLDDEVVAFRLAEAQLLRRPMGRSALRDVLTTRQFPEGIVDRAVRRAYENTTEHAVAVRFLVSLSVKFADPMRETRRRAALLAARGFPEDVIEALLISGLSDQGIS